jgi:mono/diheme cytochrome c family protein
VGTHTWYYPSRAECLRCHTGAAGFSLGLETGQLNRDLHYTATQRISNQLATFEHIGLFEGPLPAQEGRQRYAVPSGDEGLEQRARAYLHANCSSCHRPNGTGRGPQDFRYSTPLAQASLCNAMPLEGDLGITNARLLAPGEPARSVLSVRMHSLGAYRMPPLASRVEDTTGTALVDAWISSLTACP